MKNGCAKSTKVLFPCCIYSTLHMYMLRTKNADTTLFKSAISSADAITWTSSHMYVYSTVCMYILLMHDTRELGVMASRARLDFLDFFVVAVNKSTFEQKLKKVIIRNCAPILVPVFEEVCSCAKQG